MCPDISMCPSETCPTRQNCYRNPASGTEPSSHRQAWMSFRWTEPEGRCDSFLQVWEKREEEPQMRTHHVTCDRCGDTKKTDTPDKFPSDWKRIKVEAEAVDAAGMYGWSDYLRYVDLCVPCQGSLHRGLTAMFDLPKVKEAPDGR